MQKCLMNISNSCFIFTFVYILKKLILEKYPPNFKNMGYLKLSWNIGHIKFTFAKSKAESHHSLLCKTVADKKHPQERNRNLSVITPILVIIYLNRFFHL